MFIIYKSITIDEHCMFDVVIVRVSLSVVMFAIICCQGLHLLWSLGMFVTMRLCTA